MFDGLQNYYINYINAGTELFKIFDVKFMLITMFRKNIYMETNLWYLGTFDLQQFGPCAFLGRHKLSSFERLLLVFETYLNLFPFDIFDFHLIPSSSFKICITSWWWKQGWDVGNSGEVYDCQGSLSFLNKMLHCQQLCCKSERKTWLVGRGLKNVLAKYHFCFSALVP